MTGKWIIKYNLNNSRRRDPRADPPPPAAVLIVKSAERFAVALWAGRRGDDYYSEVLALAVPEVLDH